MKYYINYTQDGKILGFTKGATDLNIEVSNPVWFKNQGMNKIIIDGENISFDKVDWRTPEEIEIERINNINARASNIIISKYPLYKQNNITLLLTPYTEIDLEEMKMYIETVRGIVKDAKNNNTPFEDINWGGLD